MGNINNFRKDAIIIIYPDGLVKEVAIDKRLLHMKYFIDLYKEDKYFKEFTDDNEIVVPNDIDFSNSTTYSLDKELARSGVIVLHNLFIDEIYENDKFIDSTPPQFYVSIPSVMSDEQKNILNELCDNYDMSCSLYGQYLDDELDDITYDELIEILKTKKK